MLKMPKHDAVWHKRDMEDELKELKEANGFVHVWSELSDVVYTYTRAKWSGYRHFKWPLKWYMYFAGIPYMFVKYTLRWLFFMIAGILTDKKIIKEVRNPRKLEKLRVIAMKNGLNSDKFEKKCQKLLKIWPLIK